MPVKYVCPKCNRRFTEWGAEKYGFKCPDDEWRAKDHPNDVELVRLGPSDDRPTRRPALKKGARKLAVSLPAGYGDETPVSEVGDIETAAEFVDTDEAFDDADSDEEEESVDEEVVVVAAGESEVVAAGVDSDLVDDSIVLEVADDEGDADDDSAGEESVEEDWQE